MNISRNIFKLMTLTGISLVLLVWSPVDAASKKTVKKTSKPAVKNLIKADSQIKSVTVYLDRAQVVRKMSRQFQPGKYTILFDNLPDAIDRNSVQINGTGSVTLNDVKFGTEYFSETPDKTINKKQKELQKLKDAQEDLKDKVANIKEEKQFVKQISTKLTTVSQKSTNNPQLDPNKWIRMVDFHRNRLAKLDREMRTAQRQQRQLEKDIEKLQNQLDDLDNTRNKSRKQVKAVVLVEQAGPVDLSLSYIVKGPGWSPVYDIRVFTNEKQMGIVYNAVIRQNTGEDWKDVEIQLSTARPNLSGTPPKLNPWRISLYKPQPVYPAAPASVYEGKPSPKKAMTYDRVAKKERRKYGHRRVKKPAMKRNRVAVETKATSVVYKISEKYTVKSDNQAHKVTIMDRKFKAKFQYSTTPKLSRFAYLKAQVKNDSGYAFIGGRSNIFLDNSFVSNSSLKSIAPNETFWTYLGVDEGVKVEYKFIKKHENKEGVFTKLRKFEFEYLIRITNNKKQKLDLVVQDQLPISSNEKLKVKLLEPAISEESKNIKIDKTRFVKWKFQPDPGQKIEIPFRFSVEFPAEENLRVSDPLFGLIH